MGISASMLTWSPWWFMLVISPLRPARFSMTAPMDSLRDFQEQLFDRLQQVAVRRPSAIDDLGPGDEHFVAFAAHLLDEDGDLHFAAAADVEDVRGRRSARCAGRRWCGFPSPGAPRCGGR